MREHDKDYRDNALLDLYAARRVDAQQFSDLWNRLPNAPILKHTTQVPNKPVQGMFVVDPAERAFCFYLGTEWICLRNNPLSHAIKINGDKKANKVENGAFKFTIDPLLDGTVLTFFGAFNGTPGTGGTSIAFENRTRVLTPATVTIAGGSTYGFGGTIDSSGSVNDPHNMVHTGNDIWINCTAIGAGSKGLGCYLYFEYPEIIP